MKPTILFICEHGAAKSIIAATYFNKLANEKGLNIQAIARGTNPDETLSPKTIQGLENDGLQAAQSIPQKLTLEEIKSAEKVITFCTLAHQQSQQANQLDDWSSVPPVSENYQIARDVIVKNINQLIESLTK